MLPRAAYVDPAVFGWEQRHFFGGGWLCVARSDQLPRPGDQRAEATGQGGVLMVRGEDGVLRLWDGTTGTSLTTFGPPQPPKNAAQAAALNPYALDVASGVELVPGVKDPDKLASFITNAKSSRIESGFNHGHAKLSR